MKEIKKNNSENLWKKFAVDYSLNDLQLMKFKKFYQLLIKINKIHNLTAITDLKSVIKDHFEDSLALSKCFDVESIKTLSDVGAGGGFPSIPLKIKYPHLNLVLIEVIGKKIEFLKNLVQELDLSNVEISNLDWRTFLRKTEYPIDVFCARASLAPGELVRAFKHSCFYENTTVIYWASKNWKADDKLISYIDDDCWYNIDKKRRRLIFLKN